MSEVLKQKYWMPLDDEYGSLNFLCENLGDATENMAVMWEQICKDHPELPKSGFADNDNLI